MLFKAHWSLYPSFYPVFSSVTCKVLYKSSLIDLSIQASNHQIPQGHVESAWEATTVNTITRQNLGANSQDKGHPGRIHGAL